MCSSSRTSFSFNHVELVVAIVGFLVLSPGGMPGTQTVRGGVIPGTRSKARKPLWHKEPPVGPLKQSHATFNFDYPPSIWAVGFDEGISNQELVDFACEGDNLSSFVFYLI
jgi:hypothetical protein